MWRMIAGGMEKGIVFWEFAVNLSDQGVIRSFDNHHRSEMAANWIGSIVSIDCGEGLGVYQGRVSLVDPNCQTIALTEPFHNGKKYSMPEVTFSALNIKELKILEIPVQVDNGRVCDPQHTEPGQTVVSGPEYISSLSQNGTNKGFNKPNGTGSVPQAIPRRGSACSRHPSQATPKKNGVKNGQIKNKDDECFGDDIEEIPDTDFDFEGNLALFDKAAVFEEIDTHERRNGSRSRGTPNEKLARYRHDENIIESEPIVYRQIVVPQHGGKEYCTDSGLVVPSVSYELHKKLLAVAEKYGLTVERRLEMAGVCSSQMALTLLGGPNRLNPKNVHQRPTVALLCGPHVKGAQGISCGRHLANHEVHVILFLPNFVKMLESITNELMLFSKTGGKQVASVKDLPDTPVDLVINCLDCHENAFLRDQPWYRAVVDWANQNRAPVLSIDPPVDGFEQAIDAKWSLALGLPLPLGECAGRVYLCDIGIPKRVFQEVGIKYHSPFGSKFVIPLHST
ncbi:enhancer of mRNA-decapping protein 3 isoform X2 [Protopterus annectens]|uniref:enhancer of mRNA-decapping protein 3 isoform X2 n=1 Tax=Protopterus annectens TaxID=7888 RepID=UPI001CFB28C0|nr:enhancer of mRNA-decapping protein 3 isoform X2 [Protopterus annectens]